MKRDFWKPAYSSTREKKKTTKSTKVNMKINIKLKEIK
jgi:hypothetical protein